MIDKNINEQNIVKNAKKKLGVIKAGSWFLTGVGLCFLFAYPGMSYHMQSQEEKYTSELNGLKNFLKERNDKKDSNNVSSNADISSNINKNI
jgi:hypothetical protein